MLLRHFGGTQYKYIRRKPQAILHVHMFLFIKKFSGFFCYSGLCVAFKSNLFLISQAESSLVHLKHQISLGRNNSKLFVGMSFGYLGVCFRQRCRREVSWHGVLASLWCVFPCC